MAAPRSLSSYRYCYAVNLHIQREHGQSLPTFTPVPRDPLTKDFARIAGNGTSRVALYYVDEPINFSDPRSIERATEAVLRGGPNVAMPDEDDGELLRRIKDNGTFTEDAFQTALQASQELKAVMAADGHFKFSFV
jgi:hypothetical protein